MNDKVNYYAILPATVRYDNRLKANEKLLYGEITSLSNRNGYCYAQNRYFADLYNVSIHTVSQWISHLEKLNYITTEVIRGLNKEIQERRIYINDVPYVLKNTYPPVQKDTYPMYGKVQENNIKYNKDDLFNLIINNSTEIEKEFLVLLNRLELVYTQEILSIMQQNNIEKIKDIIYVLYEIYNSNFNSLLSQISRESLLNLYTISKEHKPDDLLNYYKRTIINKYTNDST